MSFDPAVETPIRLQDVPKIKWILGRSPGAGVGVATVFRWAKIGRNGVVLETIQMGAKCTSEAALRRFFARLENPSAPVTVTPALRKKQTQRTLQRAGI